MPVAAIVLSGHFVLPNAVWLSSAPSHAGRLRGGLVSRRLSMAMRSVMAARVLIVRRRVAIVPRIVTRRVLLRLVRAGVRLVGGERSVNLLRVIGAVLAHVVLLSVLDPSFLRARQQCAKGQTLG